MPKSLLSASIFLLAILGLLFFVWPKYKTLGEKKQDLELTAMQLTERENYFANLRQVSKKLKENEEAISMVDAAVPQESEMGRLFYFLFQSAKVNGLLMSEVGNIAVKFFFPLADSSGQPSSSGQSPQATGPKLRSISFPIVLFGDYPSFKNFLASLEKSARLIEVNSITVVPSGEEQKSGLFRFTLDVKTNSY